MAHAQKPDFVFRRNRRAHLNRRGRQLSRLLATEVCASAEVMLDTPCSKVMWRVLATHSIRQFPLHFPSRASPCAITFQLDSLSTPWGHIGGGEESLHSFLTSPLRGGEWLTSSLGRFTLEGTPVPHIRFSIASSLTKHTEVLTRLNFFLETDFVYDFLSPS